MVRNAESRASRASSIFKHLQALPVIPFGHFWSYQVGAVKDMTLGPLPQDAGDSHQMVTVETMHSVAESIKRNQDEVSISVLPGSVRE